MQESILVLGATGTVGKPLVQRLVRRGEKVKAGSRSVDSIDGVQVVEFDFRRPDTFAPALVDVNRVYLSAPTGELDSANLLRSFVDAAIGRGVKIVMHTAMGVDADDGIPLRQVELQIQSSGAPYVFLRPNWFMDNFSTYWLPGIREHDAITLPVGDAKTSFIAADDIALAAADVLTTDKFDGRALDLTGDEALSYADAAEILSKVTGRSIRFSATDNDTFQSYLTSNGVTSEYARHLTNILYPVAQGWMSVISPHLREITGQKAKTVAEYVQENAQNWRK